MENHINIEAGDLGAGAEGQCVCVYHVCICICIHMCVCDHAICPQQYVWMFAHCGDGFVHYRRFDHCLIPKLQRIDVPIPCIYIYIMYMCKYTYIYIYIYVYLYIYTSISHTYICTWKKNICTYIHI